MDEIQAQVSIDLSGRPFFSFKGQIPREKVGELPVEMVPHFFRTISDRLGLTLHMEVTGENAHHMVESLFKAFARALKASLARTSGAGLPSTKGSL